MTALRWLAFGDLDGAVWGTAWVPEGAGTGHVALGAGDRRRVVEAELDGGGADEDWRFRADGLELFVSPSSPNPGDSAPASGSGRLDQLVHATGGFTIDGDEHRVDSPGWRAVQPDLPERAELASLRLVVAWFDGEDALALLAVRPRRAHGHEDDQITAALLESGSPQTVVDPRLSTTYSGEGAPARAGLELWVSEPTEDPGTAAERPHRIAGEAVGRSAGWTEDGFVLGAQPFRWHSHHRDGAGVYVLGRIG